MPPESEAIAQPVVPTVAVTAPAAPAAISAPTERVEPAVVNEEYLGKLTPAQSREINEAIRKAIPRDAKGKALASAHDGLMDTTLEPEPAPVVEPSPDPEPEPEPTVTPEPTPAVVPPDPELEPDPTDGKLPQHRVRARDSFDDQVMRRYNNAIRDGNPVSMEACVAAEKAAQGILAPTKPADTAVGKTLDTANAELATLREQRKTAKAAYDVDAEEAATTAIEDKLQEISDLKEDARARQQAEQHQRQTAWTESSNKAVALYPDVAPEKGKPLSETGKRLIAAKDRLYEEHKASNDPLRFRTDYPLLLLHLAAAEEGIAPSTIKKAPSPAPKPASTRSVTPAKPAPPLASASARTTQNGTGPTSVAALLEKGMTLRESKEINKELRKLVRR